jgi:hypothetical protein
MNWKATLGIAVVAVIAAVVLLFVVAYILRWSGLTEEMQGVLLGVAGVALGSILSGGLQVWGAYHSQEAQMRLAKHSHETQVRLANLNYENQMRLAALDKRLEVHQKAFTLWYRLVYLSSEKDPNQFLVDCQTWWEQHCLYLTEEAVRAFHKAVVAANDLRSLGYDSPDRVGIAAFRADVRAAGPIITAGIALPSIGQLEPNKITLESNTTN